MDAREFAVMQLMNHESTRPGVSQLANPVTPTWPHPSEAGSSYLTNTQPLRKHSELLVDRDPAAWRHSELLFEKKAMIPDLKLLLASGLQ